MSIFGKLKEYLIGSRKIYEVEDFTIGDIFSCTIGAGSPFAQVVSISFPVTQYYAHIKIDTKVNSTPIRNHFEVREAREEYVTADIQNIRKILESLKGKETILRARGYKFPTSSLKYLADRVKPPDVSDEVNENE